MVGRTQEAIDEYAQFLRTHPEHAPATLNTGYALASLGRCSEAIPYFERTLALRPGDSAAQRNLRRRPARCPASCRWRAIARQRDEQMYRPTRAVLRTATGRDAEAPRDNPPPAQTAAATRGVSGLTS
jgi:tetratricopeptide (TPR) repeat protein